MASIAGTNAGYIPFRNRMIGSADDIPAPITDADTFAAFFSDDADYTPDDGDVFASAYAAGDNPNGYAAWLVLTNPTFGSVAAGVWDCDTMTFTGANAVAAGDPVESLVICKKLTDATASAVMIHIGSATGLTGGLTPTGADVTVVPSTSGVFGV